MVIELSKLKEDEIIVLRNLFEYGVYDLSDLSLTTPRKPGVRVIDFRAWYDDENFHMYLIKADHAVTGFVIVKYLSDEEVYYLNHFFILEASRMRGIGQKAAQLAFDLFRGDWRVSQFDKNVAAIEFWRKVIERYTGGSYSEARRADDKGPSQQFSNGRSLQR